MNLTEKAKDGLIWSGGFRLLQNLTQFGLTLILARLLVPEDYGTYAIVAGIVGVINAVSFENFLRHILQIRNQEKVHYQDHFTAAVCIQTAIFLLANTAAIALRWVPAYADTAHYIHVMSPAILLCSIGGFRYVMLERELDWRRYRSLQASGLVFTTATALVLASSGAGVYALLLAPLGKYIPPAFDLLFVKKWRPTWALSWQHYRSAFRFGLNRLGAGFIRKSRVMLEANALLILIGLGSLGYLNRSVGITQLVALQFATLVGQALYPVLTRIEPGTERYRRASGLVFRGTAWVIIPVSVLLGILAVPTINTLLGAKWSLCAELLPYSLAVGTVAGLGQSAYQLLLANCNQWRCLCYDLIRLAGLVVALSLWPLLENLPSYLLAVAGFELVGLVSLLLWLQTTRAMKSSDMLAALLPPVIGASLGLAALGLWEHNAMPAGLFTWTTLFIAVQFSFPFLIVIRCFFGKQLKPILEIVPAPLGMLVGRLLLFRLPTQLQGT